VDLDSQQTLWFLFRNAYIFFGLLSGLVAFTLDEFVSLRILVMVMWISLGTALVFSLSFVNAKSSLQPWVAPALGMSLFLAGIFYKLNGGITWMPYFILVLPFFTVPFFRLSICVKSILVFFIRM